MIGPDYSAFKGKLRSVLYVDDDPDICEVVQATLCLVAGLTVQTAGSGELAIDRAYEMRPDLIIMDVMMPGLDGPMTLKRMRESRLISGIPIIFLTAKILPAEVARFLELGAIGVIGKPFDPLKLGDEVLARWEARHSMLGIKAAPDARKDEKAEVRVQVDSLADRFVRRTGTDVVRLGAMLDHARAGKWSELGELGRLAHSIYGAGAMFGFPLLSATAGAIERLVGDLPPGDTASERIGESALSRLAICIGQLSREVEAARGTAPLKDCLYQDGALGR
jgi:two-component system OmpR family response regulator